MKSVYVSLLLTCVSGCGQVAGLGDIPPAAVPEDDSSCKQIHITRPLAPSGEYLIHDGRTFATHCEMSLDGGGWTAIFSGVNGSPNYFESFEADFDDSCPDPATRCIHRPPSSLSLDTEMMATCGANAVVFKLRDEAGIRFFVDGVPEAWVHTVGQRVVAGNVDPAFARQLWTGEGGNLGWILSENDAPPYQTAHTFSSGYNYNANWDYCAGEPDTSSLIRLYYR